MIALFVANSLADSSSRNWNNTGQLFLGDFHGSLDYRQEWWVTLQLLCMVDWTSGSGRRSGALKTTAFVAFAIRMRASLVTESKKHSVAGRVLAFVYLEGSIRLANGGQYQWQVLHLLDFSS